jgi:two-component system, chemotaxis family, protein-glutamate methylesterase/glutaminase
MLRVVVIDDSPVARDLIVEILNSAADIEVVGVAKDGVEGVAMVAKFRPDLVTMDGYQATLEIMIAQPTPIVVVSGSGGTDVDKSMRSLQAGALTVIGKPSAPSSSKFEQTAEVLIDTVRSMARVKVVRQVRRQPPPGQAIGLGSSSTPAVVSEKMKIVAIGASTGGPQTVHQILSGLPQNFSLPILYVQHISDGFTEGLAQWLTSTTPLTVCVARAGEALQPGIVYLGPEGHHLEVSAGSQIVLTKHPPMGGFRPAASVMFDSVARAFGPQALALLLTGMGRDGVDGLKAVRQLGGKIIAQDQASCVVYGMPRVAVEEGLVDAIMNPQEIVQCLTRL